MSGSVLPFGSISLMEMKSLPRISSPAPTSEPAGARQRHNRSLTWEHRRSLAGVEQSKLGCVRRKKASSRQDNSYNARGWVEGVLKEDMIEGLFSSDGVLDQSGGLQLVANGEAGLCPWEDVQSVTVKPRHELPVSMVRLHYDNVFAKSDDPYVFVGWLPDFQGIRGQNPFVLAPCRWPHLGGLAGPFPPGRLP
jgi:hypothetical protein